MCRLVMLLLAIGALAPVLVAIGSESKWSPGVKNIGAMYRMKVIGSTVCPACAMSGHDADSCRANLLEGNVIGCHTCGAVIPESAVNARSAVQNYPIGVKMAVAQIIRGLYKTGAPVFGLTLVHSQDGIGEISSERAAAAVACGNADVLLDADNKVKLVFKGDDPIADLSLSFDRRNAGTIPQAALFALFNGFFPGKGDELYDELVARLCPPDLARAAQRLAWSGFTVKHRDLGSSLSRLVLAFGDKADLQVEVTYYP